MKMKQEDNTAQKNKEQVSYWRKQLYDAVASEVGFVMNPELDTREESKRDSTKYEYKDWKELLSAMLQNPESSLNKALGQFFESYSDIGEEELQLDGPSKEIVLEMRKFKEPSVDVGVLVDWISNKRFDEFMNTLPKKTERGEGNSEEVSSKQVELMRGKVKFGDLPPHKARSAANLYQMYAQGQAGFDAKLMNDAIQDEMRFSSKLDAAKTLEEKIETTASEVLSKLKASKGGDNEQQQALNQYAALRNQVLKPLAKQKLHQMLDDIKSKDKKSIEEAMVTDLENSVLSEFMTILQKPGLNHKEVYDYVQKEISGAMQQVGFWGRYDLEEFTKNKKLHRFEDQHIIKEKVLATLTERIKDVMRIDDPREAKTLMQAQNLLTDVFDEFKGEQKQKGSVAQKALGNYRLQTESKDRMRVALTSDLQQLLQEGKGVEELKALVRAPLLSGATKHVTKRPSVSNAAIQRIKQELTKEVNPVIIHPALVENGVGEVSAQASSTAEVSAPKSVSSEGADKAEVEGPKYKTMDAFLNDKALANNQAFKIAKRKITAARDEFNSKFDAFKASAMDAGLLQEAKAAKEEYQKELNSRLGQLKKRTDLSDEQKVKISNTLLAEIAKTDIELAQQVEEKIRKEEYVEERERYSLDAAKAAEESSRRREAEEAIRDRAEKEREITSDLSKKMLEARAALDEAEKNFTINDKGEVTGLSNTYDEELNNRAYKLVEELQIQHSQYINFMVTHHPEIMEEDRDITHADISLGLYQETLNDLESDWDSLEVELEKWDIDKLTLPESKDLEDKELQQEPESKRQELGELAQGSSVDSNPAVPVPGAGPDISTDDDIDFDDLGELFADDPQMQEALKDTKPKPPAKAVASSPGERSSVADIAGKNAAQKGANKENKDPKGKTPSKVAALAAKLTAGPDNKQPKTKNSVLETSAFKTAIAAFQKHQPKAEKPRKDPLGDAKRVFENNAAATKGQGPGKGAKRENKVAGRWPPSQTQKT